MAVTTIPARPVLADLVPGFRLVPGARLVPAARTRDVTLVLMGVAFIAVASQITIPLWFTPVPLSLSTFAVLLTGTALGPRRAALCTGLYLALGVLGAPIFAGQGSGWAFASFGYVIGYIPAAVAAGALARRGADRNVFATIGLASLASLLVYAVGLPFLIVHLNVDLGTGLSMGLWPFLAGDAIKAMAAALLLPTAWKLLDR